MTPILSAVMIQATSNGLVNLLLNIVIFGLIFWIIWYFLDWIKLPEPFNKVGRVILMLVGIIFLINLLLGLGGHGY